MSGNTLLNPEPPPNINLASTVDVKHQTYGPDKCYWIDSVYIIAILVWFLIICYFELYTSRAAIFLWIPFIVFLIGWSNSADLSPEIEEDMFKASYLSVGLVLSLPLMTWMSKDFNGSRQMFTSVIIVTMVLTLLTLIDIWVAKRWLSVYKHGRSCLQTMAVCLFIFALITYYMDKQSFP